MTSALVAPSSAGTGLPTYDWTEPPRPQNGDWDCSQESCEWMLYAWGRTPDDTWMQNSMIQAGVISVELGCLDASGAGLASWLNTEYGEFGYWAENDGSVSFDDVMNEARTKKHPLAVGGRAFYHWVGVRGYDPMMDRLLLANPAPGYKGVYQTLNRQQWANLGSWSLVRLTHPEAEGGATAAMPGGIDVASYQKLVDWTAFKAAGGAFAWSKASGGAWYTNPYHAPNWAGMSASSTKRGAYHYAFEPSGQSLPGPGPEAEAGFFLDHVGPLGPGDMLALDIEVAVEDVARWSLRFCEQVEKLVGFPPVIYTGKWFADEHNFAAVPDLARYLLWLAAYQGQMPPPCAPWNKVSFWQFTDAAQVPGVAGPCDGNWFNGSTDELAVIGKPGFIPDGTDPYLPWRGLVGSGLLEMMETDGTLPAQSRSTWLPLGQSPADIEQCIGQNGVAYGWTVSTTNQGFRYRPA